jgi:hypothetical protein
MTVLENTSAWQKYLEKIKLNDGDAWRTDELFIKIKGNMNICML